MSRIAILKEHPRRTLSVLTAALIAVGVGAGTGADFSDESANPSNTFAAGTLQIDNTLEGAAIFTPSNMKPGAAAQTGTVDIENDGSLPGTFSLSRDNLSTTEASGGTDADPDIPAQIDLVVKDCGDFSSGTPTCDSGDPTSYSGTLAGFTSSAPLGTFAAGEKHRYQFSAQLKSAAGNAYQGDQASARFVWNAQQ